MGHEDWHQVTDSLRRCIKPNGLLCFSFGGSHVRDLLANGDRFSLENQHEDGVSNMLAAYADEGFGFLQQRESKGVKWGRSLARYDWVLDFLKQRAAKIVLFTEQGYANRQDIICVQFKDP